MAFAEYAKYDGLGLAELVRRKKYLPPSWSKRLYQGSKPIIQK